MTYLEAFCYAVERVGYGRTQDKVNALIRDELDKNEIAQILVKWSDWQSK